MNDRDTPSRCQTDRAGGLSIDLTSLRALSATALELAHYTPLRFARCRALRFARAIVQTAASHGTGIQTGRDKKGQMLEWTGAGACTGVEPVR